MGAPLAAATSAEVAFLESLTQPDATRASPLADTVPTETDPIRKRPSVVIGGDLESLAAVRVVHSPRSSVSAGWVPASPTSATRSVTTPKARGAWRRKMFGSGWTGPVDALGSFAVLVVTVVHYGAFLRWNETRSDVASRVSLADPVLHHLPTLDCSAALSVLVYGSILAAFKYAHRKPDVLLEFVQTHVTVIWVRMLALYLTPLEAPVGTVPLVDPIAHPDGTVLVRDLFFSGHTATTFALFIGTRRHDRAWKWAFGVATLVTAVGVLIQKAHYTIDVVAAPFFVNAAHSLVVTARQTIGAALAKPDKHQAAKHFHAPPAKAKKL